MNDRRRLPLLPLLLLAACGAGGGDDNDDATATAAEPAPAQTAPPASAASAPRLVRLGNFTSPVFVGAPPGDRSRVFVVEQGGRVIVLVNGRRQSAPFLDIRSRVLAGGEQGLLSMAFAPDFAKTGRFYVYYTDRSARQRVVELRAGVSKRSRAILGSARTVMVMADPEGNHNGGQLQFGPDKLLYIGTGDGGGANDQHGSRGFGQDLGSLLGKLLRIDPRRSGGRAYRIPSDNPFARRSGARREIYSYGLRNPWRFSFDRSTGDITIADVGQNEVEEVNFARRDGARGVNYGWRPFEGSRRNFDEPASGHVLPVIEESHGDGWCSVTGGYVVRDRGVPSLFGRYVYSDFCKGEIHSARLVAGRKVSGSNTGLSLGSVSSFGEDGRGRVYVASLEGGVFRIA